MPSLTTGSELVEEGLGARLRSSRKKRGFSLQQLATRAGVSASFLSQIETGKSQPSVATLFALATGLGMPIDDLFGDRGSGDGLPHRVFGAHAPPQARPWNTSEYSNRVSLIHPAHRARLEPVEGVIWERLAATPDHGVNFKRITYAPGAASAPGAELVSHAGHEYGFGISGEVEVIVGNMSTILGAGESIDFDSIIPHVLRNVGHADFIGIWVDHYQSH